MTKDVYSIPFKGLSVGNHSFDFEVGKSFFEDFDYFEGTSGELFVHIDLLKDAALMNLSIQMQGELNLQCDRCLDTFKQTVNGTFSLYIKFGEAFEEESDEVIVLPLTENRIDMGQYFFEYINMLLPLKKIHPDKSNGESGCDLKMIEQLNQYSEPQEDPRWAALKKLKLK